MTKKAKSDAALLDREPLREPIRVPHGRAVALDRDGNPVYRRAAGQTDKFYIDPAIIERGWTYEWKRYSVYNMTDPGYESHLAQNGWRPVPSERHEGVFMPIGHKGPIIRDGLILMERPAVLTQEAREEELKKARERVGNAKRQHGLPTADGERVVVHQRSTGIREEVGAIEVTGQPEYDLG